MVRQLHGADGTCETGDCGPKPLNKITKDRPRILNELDNLEQELIRLHSIESLTIQLLKELRKSIKLNQLELNYYVLEMMKELKDLLPKEKIQNGNTSNKT